MEWMERFNTALTYIEENLAGQIDPAQAARLACCSEYHFQRIFSYLAEVPLAEYIRRRRMTLAAEELQSGAKVTDLALRYGYASPTAFNRAFQGVHGVSPTQAREEGVALRAYPPIRFHISVKGGAPLEYRLETREAFRIVGASCLLDEDLEKNFTQAPQLWSQVAADGTLERIAALMEGPPMGVLGVSACLEPGQWSYWTAVASSKSVEPPLGAYTVPTATWAIFPGQGPMPDAIQELEKRVVMEWFPASGYEYADAPDIELYLVPDPRNAKFEVWVPVRRAQGGE